MHVRLEITDDYVVCRLEGTLEWATVGSLRAAMGLLDSVPRIVIDLSDVTFVDCAGVSALVGSIRRVRDKGGRVIVRSTRERVNQLLATIGFDRVVPVATTVEQAADLMADTRSSLSGGSA